MRFTKPLSTWAAAVCSADSVASPASSLSSCLSFKRQHKGSLQEAFLHGPHPCRAHTTSGLPQHPRIRHFRTCHTGLCFQRVRLRGLMQSSWGTGHFVVVKSLGTIRRTAAISGMKPPLLGTEFSLYGQVVSPWALLRKNQKPDQFSTL